MTSTRVLLCGVLSALLLGSANAQPADPVATHLYFEAAYVREMTDGPWQFQISGHVPSLAGCYLVVHDARRIILQRHIPHGRRDRDDPLRITVPADGITGDYRVVILGFQNDILEMDLPLTDLPHEVYGRRSFAAAADAVLLFRVPRDTTQLTFLAYSGSLRVLENGRQLLDVKEQGQARGRSMVATVTVTPEADYQLQPYNTFYFSVEQGVYFSGDLRRWFVPDDQLDEVKWWQWLE